MSEMRLNIVVKNNDMNKKGDKFFAAPYETSVHVYYLEQAGLLQSTE